MRRCYVGPLALTALLTFAQTAVAQSNRDGELEHQGVARLWELHLPPGAPEVGPRPLVVALHGLDEQEEDWHRAVGWLRAWWTMDAVADAERGGFQAMSAIGTLAEAPECPG